MHAEADVRRAAKNSKKLIPDPGVVEELCLKAVSRLPQDVRQALAAAEEREKDAVARRTLGLILENARLAAERGRPLCQDTGLAVVFVELGQEVCLAGDLVQAVNEGVRRAYVNGRLRRSVVGDPLIRENTGDNTPAILHVELVPGDTVKLTVAPKGIGSENMSRLAMLKPADGREGVIRFVLETVVQAGPNACPPLVVGVGLGGTMERAAYLAKKALLRRLDEPNPKPHLRELEAELLRRVNDLGIGPEGLGGRTTALGVSVEAFPTHIGGLPVAVNLQCHAARHAAAVWRPGRGWEVEA
ncbi:MAG: fumarate hydratase subunit alpha [Bacillota bacterium]|nr:fumarate hydratase subunit alpha [Bacillota bacterium]MDK2927364.1 fumarate hydratase subunit alpha [Bacillota bacterium]